MPFTRGGIKPPPRVFLWVLNMEVIDMLWDERITVLSEKYPMAIVLAIVMSFDILTGWIAAGIERKLSSKVGFNGMLRKVIILMVIGMCAAVERVQPDIPLVKLSSLFFVFNECLSIVENAKRAKVPIPKVLDDALHTREKLANGASTMHFEVKNVSADVSLEKQQGTAPPHSPTDPEVK